jgi:putative transposase
MARVLGVSESGYYRWLSRKPSKRAEEDLVLIEEIAEIFYASRRVFGSRKITSIMRSRGRLINHKRVVRLMSEYCLYSRVCKEYNSFTEPGDGNNIKENLLKRDFSVTGPDQKMVSDTTGIRTKEGWLYVAGILDLCGRIPVGMATGPRNDTKLVSTAFRDMRRRGHGGNGCILHSDRGSTYSSSEYQELISSSDMLSSMSRKGDCWDNAPMEGFWGKMKLEFVDRTYDTLDEARSAVYEYVWSFYTNLRPHAANGYLTPAEYYKQARSQAIF